MKRTAFVSSALSRRVSRRERIARAGAGRDQRLAAAGLRRRRRPRQRARRHPDGRRKRRAEHRHPVERRRVPSRPAGDRTGRKPSPQTERPHRLQPGAQGPARALPARPRRAGARRRLSEPQPLALRGDADLGDRFARPAAAVRLARALPRPPLLRRRETGVAVRSGLARRRAAGGARRFARRSPGDRRAERVRVQHRVAISPRSRARACSTTARGRASRRIFRSWRRPRAMPITAARCCANRPPSSPTRRPIRRTVSHSSSRSRRS